MNSMNIFKEVIPPILHKLIGNRRGNNSQFILGLKHYKIERVTRKLQTSIFHEYRHKNIQNISKLNPAANSKNYIP